MFKHLKKIENLVVLLVVVSAISILIYKSVPRELTISPGSGWTTETADDRVVGGNSFSADLSDDNQFAFRYEIRPGDTNPFAVLLIGAGEDNFVDLGWMETVSITAHTEGQASGDFRLQLRNLDEEYYSPEDNVSMRYDEVCLKLTNQPTTQVIPRDNFYVPAWWIERMSVPVNDSRPKVDRIAWIELNTSNLTEDSKECKAIISEIKFTGYWISASLFYQCMLGMWLCFGTLVALSQIIGLRKSLTQSKSMELNLQRQAAELTQLATHDPLTQLFNRRGMREHVTRAMSDLQQAGNPFSLIMFDVDNFKAHNDEHGHSRGDNILQELASVASDSLTEDDPLARWGGEEFLMICKGCKLDLANQLAEQLRKKIEEQVKVTCSFGVCEVGLGAEFSAALDLVDDCLYQAKNAGKNCVKSASIGTPPVSPKEPALMEDSAGP